MKVSKLLEFLSLAEKDDDVFIEGYTHLLEIRVVKVDMGDENTTGTITLCTVEDEFLPGDGPDDGEFDDDDVDDECGGSCSLEPTISAADESKATIEKP